jgi:hypothetical protein
LGKALIKHRQLVERAATGHYHGLKRWFEVAAKIARKKRLGRILDLSYTYYLNAEGCGGCGLSAPLKRVQATCQTDHYKYATELAQIVCYLFAFAYFTRMEVGA